jgi:hypothetical protein
MFITKGAFNLHADYFSDHNAPAKLETIGGPPQDKLESKVTSNGAPLSPLSRIRNFSGVLQGVGGQLNDGESQSG